jgi:hypothetical protein
MTSLVPYAPIRLAAAAKPSFTASMLLEESTSMQASGATQHSSSSLIVL